MIKRRSYNILMPSLILVSWLFAHRGRELRTKSPVRDSWRKAGMNAPPACASRVLARAAKRSQVDYAGSDRKLRKKRRKVKQSNDPTETGAVPAGQESPAGTVCLRQSCNMNEPITAENTAFAEAKLRADTVGATAPTLEDNGICEPEQVHLSSTAQGIPYLVFLD